MIHIKTLRTPPPPSRIFPRGPIRRSRESHFSTQANYEEHPGVRGESQHASRTTSCDAAKNLLGPGGARVHAKPLSTTWASATECRRRGAWARARLRPGELPTLEHLRGRFAAPGSVRLVFSVLGWEEGGGISSLLLPGRERSSHSDLRNLK
jgi:hypothetical protein